MNDKARSGAAVESASLVIDEAGSIEPAEPPGVTDGGGGAGDGGAGDAHPADGSAGGGEGRGSGGERELGYSNHSHSPALAWAVVLRS